jgi:hypothetical protein
MAITTLDGAIAGFRAPVPITKTGIAMAALASNRAYTHWYAAGIPAAAVGNTSGVAGAAVSNTTFGGVVGAIPRADGASNNYLAKIGVSSSQLGVLWLVDRLWHNSGLSTTLTTAQAVNSVSFPARDVDGNANTGRGCFVGVEWSATGGAGTPTLTLSYLDDASIAQTATQTAVTAPPVGTVEIFNYANNSAPGVKSITSFQQSATRTSGTYHLVLYRQLAVVECTLVNVGKTLDVLTAGMPRLYNGTTLQTLWFPSATTAVSLTGTYLETQG